MRCPVCGYESAAVRSACPRCGSYLGQPLAGGTQDPPKTFRYLLAGAAMILALLGFGTYRLVSNPIFREAFRNATSLAPGRASEIAVVHGGLAKPEELQARGRLYFVPMGRQAISVESLAAYYREKFKIEVTVLPEVPVSRAAFDVDRSQYIAEEMILDMKRAYPKIARSADSIMIILTDEDIYPRSLGWNFTYSYQVAYKFAVVSSHRNDPALWGRGTAHDATAQLSGLRQMLTKYVAMLYFHVPISFDPTSIMYQPLTPRSGPDDLYESDLHSEESANGFRGSGWPCLIYSYSYETGVIRHLAPAVEECAHRPAPASVNEEIFFTQLSTGEFFESAVDFQLDSTPPIEFRRAYRSQYHQRWALGLSTNDNFNTWLYSDGDSKYSFIDVIREDDNRDHFVRVTPGTGFSPEVVFENHDGNEEIYGARLSWEQGHYKLSYRDGAWSTFLNCTDGRCYWNGYQDAEGHLLRFERDAALNLRGLASSDGQSIQFVSDNQFRIVDGRDSSGNHVTYEYDPLGRLVRIARADGQVVLYSYDIGHRVTQMSVVRKPDDLPAVVLRNEYDSSGRVIEQTLADGGVYRIEYGAASNNPSNRNVKVTEPSGRVLDVTRTSDFAYVVRTNSIRFPAKLAGLH
jgi:YD repeat-containing protein